MSAYGYEGDEKIQYWIGGEFDGQIVKFRFPNSYFDEDSKYKYDKWDSEGIGRDSYQRGGTISPVKSLEEIDDKYDFEKAYPEGTLENPQVVGPDLREYFDPFKTLEKEEKLTKDLALERDRERAIWKTQHKKLSSEGKRELAVVDDENDLIELEFITGEKITGLTTAEGKKDASIDEIIYPDIMGVDGQVGQGGVTNADHFGNTTELRDYLDKNFPFEKYGLKFESIKDDSYGGGDAVLLVSAIGHQAAYTNVTSTDLPKVQELASRVNINAPEGRQQAIDDYALPLGQSPFQTRSTISKKTPDGRYNIYVVEQFKIYLASGKLINDPKAMAIVDVGETFHGIEASEAARKDKTVAHGHYKRPDKYQKYIEINRQNLINFIQKYNTQMKWIKKRPDNFTVLLNDEGGMLKLEAEISDTVTMDRIEEALREQATPWEVMCQTIKEIQGDDFHVKNNKYIGRLMHLHINMQFISNALHNNVDNKGKVSLYKFIQVILSGVQDALGNINNFEVDYDHDLNKLIIRDLNYLKYNGAQGTKNTEKDPTRIEMFGLNIKTEGESRGSFLNNISFNVNISSKFATWAAIGAQSQGSIVGENATNISKMNLGLKDRIIFNMKVISFLKI